MNQCLKRVGKRKFGRYKGTEVITGITYRKFKNTRNTLSRVEKEVFDPKYTAAENDNPCSTISRGGRKTRRKRSKRRKTYRR